MYKGEYLIFIYVNKKERDNQSNKKIKEDHFITFSMLSIIQLGHEYSYL